MHAGTALSNGSRIEPHHHRRTGIALMLSVLLSMILVPATPAMAAVPTVNAGGPLSYTEQDPPVAVGSGIIIPPAHPTTASTSSSCPTARPAPSS